MPAWRPIGVRFFEKIQMEPMSGCWLWMGCLTKDGYGSFAIGQRKPQLAHRVSYELHRGPIPEGLEIDHLCRVRSCVNFNHLEVVLHKENVLRGDSHPARNARKTHCLRGHLLSKENTNPSKEKMGHRSCKQCGTEQNREWRIRAKGGPLAIPMKNRTHCPQGHPLQVPNLSPYEMEKGYRKCLQCIRNRRKPVRVLSEMP